MTAPLKALTSGSWKVGVQPFSLSELPPWDVRVRCGWVWLGCAWGLARVVSAERLRATNGEPALRVTANWLGASGRTLRVTGYERVTLTGRVTSARMRRWRRSSSPGRW